MKIEAISTDRAPAAIGPYSQAVRAGDFLFCSGQIPLCADGTLVEGNISEQTQQVMENLQAVIAAAGGSMSRVVKTTIYLASMDDFAVVNELYAGYFVAVPPARATVQVAGLPKGVGVEIDAVVAL